MDRQVVIDRINEVANLTDGLEDEEADWLINWGISQAISLVSAIPEEEMAGNKLNEVMEVMRRLNHITSDRTAKKPEALESDIQALELLYNQAFGTTQQILHETTAVLAEALREKSPLEAIQLLLNHVTPP